MGEMRPMPITPTGDTISAGRLRENGVGGLQASTTHRRLMLRSSCPSHGSDLRSLPCGFNRVPLGEETRETTQAGPAQYGRSFPRLGQ